MNQLDLFQTTAPAQYDDMPLAQPERTEARARASDPASSHEAAERMNETGATSTQTQQVIDAVWKWPGRTSKELAKLDGTLDRYQFARRLTNAEATGEIHRRQEGTAEITWWPGKETP